MIVEILTDEESEKEINSGVTKEKVESKKPNEKFQVVVHCTNMSIERITRKNSWFMCEKCDYKAKSKKSFKKSHSKDAFCGV